MTSSKLNQKEFEQCPKVVGSLEEEKIMEIHHQIGECILKNETKLNEEVFLEGKRFIQKKTNQYIHSDEESIQEEAQTMFIEEEFTVEGKGQDMFPKVIYKQEPENQEEKTKAKGCIEEEFQSMPLGRRDIQKENVQNTHCNRESNIHKKILERLSKIEGCIEKGEFEKKILDEVESIQDEEICEMFMEDEREYKQEEIQEKINVKNMFENITKASSSQKEEAVSDIVCQEENPLHGAVESSQQDVMHHNEFHSCREDPRAEDHEINQEKPVDQKVQDLDEINAQDTELLEDDKQRGQDPELDNHQHHLPDFFSIQSDEDFDCKNPENLCLNLLTDGSGEYDSFENSDDILKDIEGENSLENEELLHSQSVHDPEISFQYLDVFPDCRDSAADNDYETSIEVNGDQLPSYLENYLKSNNSVKNGFKTRYLSRNDDQDNIDNNNTESKIDHDNKQDMYTFGSQKSIREVNSDNNDNDIDTNDIDINTNDIDNNNNKDNNNKDNNNKDNNKDDKEYKFQTIESSVLNNLIEEVSYNKNSPLEYYNNISSIEFLGEDNGDGELPSPLRKRLEEATNTSGIDFFNYIPDATVDTSYQVIQNENMGNSTISHDYPNTALNRDDSGINLSYSNSEQIIYKDYAEVSSHTYIPSQLQPNQAENTAFAEIPTFYNRPCQKTSRQENQDYNYGGYLPMNVIPTSSTAATSHNLYNHHEDYMIQNLSNQPEEYMIPTIGYPPISSFGFPPPAIPIMCPSYIGQHILPPPITFPSIPLRPSAYVNPENIGKLPYYDPLQSSLSTWPPYTSFPGSCRPISNYNDSNSTTEISSIPNYVPEHTCTRYYSNKFDKFLPCELNNCNEKFYRNITKDFTYAKNNENIIVKMPNDVILVKNDFWNNKKKVDIVENNNSDYLKKMPNSAPEVSSTSEEQVYFQEKTYEMPIMSEDDSILSKPPIISESQQIQYEVPIPEIQIDSLEVFPIDNSSEKGGQENGRSTTKYGKLWTPQDRVSLLPGNETTYVDPQNNDNNENKIIASVDYNNNTILIDELPLGSFKKNSIENAEIQTSSLFHEVLNEGKDAYCCDETDNDCLDFNKERYSNDSYDVIRETEISYIDLTKSDSNSEEKDGKVVVDITKDDIISPKKMPMNAPQLKTYMPRFAKSHGVKVENKSKIKIPRIGFAKHPLHFAPLNYSRLEAYPSEGRKRGRPKGSKNKKSIERARETAAFTNMEASQVTRVKKQIPILPKEVISSSNVIRTRQSCKRDDLSNSKFSAATKSSQLTHESLSDILNQFSLITEYEIEERNKSNVTSHKLSANSPKSNIYPIDFDDSEEVDNHFDSEPLGCITPMEAENSEKKLELSYNINHEDNINLWLDEQSQRLATEECKNMCYEISKKNDRNINSSSEKDENGNYLMILDSGPSVSKNSDVNEMLNLESTVDPLDISSEEISQQEQLETAEETSNNKILELLDSESLGQVDQRVFSLASIDLMKQFRIVEMKQFKIGDSGYQNSTKSEKMRNYVCKNNAEANENPYKKVYKDRVHMSSSRKRSKLSNAKSRGYQDAFMNFLYKN